MISTVQKSASEMQTMGLPVVVIIDNNSLSYNDDGNTKMDKVNENRLSHYTHNNQSLCIESCFSGTAELQDLIKEYLLEQHRRKIEVADTISPQYNTSSNTVAVTSTKEGSE